MAIFYHHVFCSLVASKYHPKNSDQTAIDRSYVGAHVFNVHVHDHVIIIIIITVHVGPGHGRKTDIIDAIFPANLVMIMENARDKPFEFDGYSSINKPVSFRLGEERSSTSATRFMKLSPDGKMLALGDDSGYLEIRKRVQGDIWIRVGIYVIGGKVRAGVWHPQEMATIFVGSSKGNVCKITVSIGVGGETDDVRHATVGEFVRCLEISPDGIHLCIAYGRNLAIVERPFSQRTELGTLQQFLLPHKPSSGDLKDFPAVRGIHFVQSEIFVTLMGRCGILVYSKDTHVQKSSIPVKNNLMIGFSAVSPSGKRIATMNLKDGVDFYSTSHKKFIMSTKSPASAPQGIVTQIAFVDDDTVAVGHSSGTIYFASFGMEQAVVSFPLSQEGETQETTADLVQCIAAGPSDGQCLVFGILPTSSRNQTQSSDVVVVTIENNRALQNRETVDDTKPRRNKAQDFEYTYKGGLVFTVLFFAFYFMPLTSKNTAPLDATPNTAIRTYAPTATLAVTPTPTHQEGLPSTDRCTCICTFAMMATVATPS
ncbi:hypothetical protein M413DRAFT_26098 [Hebeloma cylindrosporum]|uniref:Cleavage/polyadenylation specificity factor A subunit N-terminal domain-containing protein n=1 Tax=Hebeloma cylindrosporum TaxID=76867 RepID=A0A0C2Y1S3_HEBCY|nr:hypothetical protein M413DRAFT_26098 [Hebeloma cylindrosporum h7]